MPISFQRFVELRDVGDITSSLRRTLGIGKDNTPEPQWVTGFWIDPRHVANCTLAVNGNSAKIVDIDNLYEKDDQGRMISIDDKKDQFIGKTVLIDKTQREKVLVQGFPTGVAAGGMAPPTMPGGIG
jgi:hypothetical protein